MRKETQYIPRIFSYQSHQTWSQNPKQLTEEAQERVRELLQRHEVPPLEPVLRQELKRIFAVAEKMMGC